MHARPTWIGNLGWALAITLVLGLALVGRAVNAAPDHVEEARAFVESLTDSAFGDLSASDRPEAEKRAVAEALLSESLAVDAIGRFALGRHWRQATAEERQEYLRLFRHFVLRGSVERMLRYSGQAFEITESLPRTSPRESENFALVRSKFYDPEPIRIDWLVANRGETIKVVDVIIEGLSLSQTYREEFTSVVRRQGMAALLTQLRDKQNILGNAAESN